MEDDPLVLLQLRGLPREDLLAALHHRRDPQAVPAPGRDDAEEVLETAEDAAVRAARILDLLGRHHDPAELDRLW